MKPWWDGLTVFGYADTVGNDDSVLTGASRMAELFFEVTGDRFAGANYVSTDNEQDNGGDSLFFSLN